MKARLDALARRERRFENTHETSENHEFDAYYFGREFHDASVTGENLAAGDLADRTIGVRMKGKALGFDYSAEAMFQNGHFAADRIDAYAWLASLGYTFDAPLTPRIGVEFDYASGDHNPTDNRRNTFDPLFPFGHFYQGFADVFAFKNGKDLSFYLKANPVEKLSVQIDYHTFWLSARRDAWYGPGNPTGTNLSGAVIRRNTAGTSDPRVGSELDLHARYAIGKFVKLWGGWSHFFPGGFVKTTPGEAIGMNWFFLQMTIDF